MMQSTYTFKEMWLFVLCPFRCCCRTIRPAPLALFCCTSSQAGLPKGEVETAASSPRMRGCGYITAAVVSPERRTQAANPGSACLNGQGTHLQAQQLFFLEMRRVCHGPDGHPVCAPPHVIPHDDVSSARPCLYAFFFCR